MPQNTSPVTLLRVPGGGIQPQTVVDGRGALHLLYFAGKPEAGDLFYVRSRDNGKTFSSPLRVNRTLGSAIAMGNIRGGQIAVGRGGRTVHVVWNGSGTAPKGAGGETPFLYARLNDAGNAFEAERNLMGRTHTLDGGGTLAADDVGGVWVFWHAFARAKGDDESVRRVWLARSRNDGRTFAPETPVWEKPTGACGCCGMRALARKKGGVCLLYRSATGNVDRDTFLLASTPGGDAPFAGARLHPWRLNACPMSLFGLDDGAAGNDTLAAWETAGQVYFSRVPGGRPGAAGPPITAPGPGGRRRYPVIAADPATGNVLMVWAEGMGWAQGGAVAWQGWDHAGRVLPGLRGRVEGVPPWSLVGVFVRPNAGFTVVY